MRIIDRTMFEIVDTDFRRYSMYTIQQRALPSAIDGMKIVNRKIVYGMLQDHKTGKVKVAEISGKMSAYEYAHGEVSAADAAIKMAAPYRNNVSMLSPHGNFGTRLVPEAASPRYIHVSISEDFKKYFCDFEVLPKNIYQGEPEPAHYLPIIPMVLLNGSEGIAVGFKCVILPRSAKTVIDAVKACLKTPEKFMADTSPLMPTFPNFRGTVEHVEGNKFQTDGIVTYIGKYTYEITELPIGYDRGDYVAVLQEMQDADLIKSYSDECDKSGFKFQVKVSLSARAEIDADPIKFFKLRKYFTELFNLIGVDGKLLQLNNARELVNYFVNYRVQKFDEKLAFDIAKVEREIKEKTWRLTFIQHVTSGKLTLSGLTKADLLEYISSKITDDSYGKTLINIPLYACTADAYNELQREIEVLTFDKLDGLMKTNSVLLFNASLKSVL